MFRSSVALLVGVLLTTTATAQRGGGGGGESRRNIKDTNWDELRAESNTGLRLSNGDVEEMDGVKRLVDKRKDLKLTDDQQQQLRDLDARLKESNTANFTMLDSLRQAMRPRVGLGEDVERARVSLTRENVIGVVATIRTIYDAGVKQAVALLDDAQRLKADALLKKLAQDSDETLRTKLGGRSATGGGRRGGGPPQ